MIDCHVKHFFQGAKKLLHHKFKKVEAIFQGGQKIASMGSQGFFGRRSLAG